ncbi:unnamed protein product [Malus baccata var. baccata]
MAAYSNFPEDSMGLNFDLVGPSSPQLPSSVFKSRANDFEERNRCGSHIRSQLNQVIVQPSMPSPINNEGAFEAFAELHHDVLGSSHLRLGAHKVNVFADPYKGKKVNVFKPGSLTPHLAPINLTPTAYRVMYAFERLNMIYEAGLGFPEFQALYLLKSIFASLSYFFSRKGDVKGRRIPVIHAASSAIFDHARFVRVVRAYLIDYAFTVADVGNVVAPVDGGTNPVKSMLKFTSIVELEDARVQSVEVDFQAPITHIPEVAP